MILLMESESPSKPIRYPTKDITSKQHTQHVDRVVNCPVRMKLVFEETDVFPRLSPAFSQTSPQSSMRVVFITERSQIRSSLEHCSELSFPGGGMVYHWFCFPQIFVFAIFPHLSPLSTCPQGKQAWSIAELPPMNPPRTFLHSNSNTISSAIFYFAYCLL